MAGKQKEMKESRIKRINKKKNWIKNEERREEEQTEKVRKKKWKIEMEETYGEHKIRTGKWINDLKLI